MTPTATDVPQPCDEDRAWLAFRYVAGELPVNEAAAFEARLDHDQEAREAVAEAVTLLTALAGSARPAGLALVGERDATARRQRRVVRGLLALSGLAAAVALLALPWFRSGPSLAGRGEVDPTVLAITWSGLWQAADADPVPALTDTPDDEPAGARTDALVAWLDEPAPSAAIEPEPDPDEAEPDVPPRWMLEAASLGETAEPGGEPGT